MYHAVYMLSEFLLKHWAGQNRLWHHQPKTNFIDYVVNFKPLQEPTGGFIKAHYNLGKPMCQFTVTTPHVVTVNCEFVCIRAPSDFLIASECTDAHMGPLITTRMCCLSRLAWLSPCCAGASPFNSCSCGVELDDMNVTFIKFHFKLEVTLKIKKLKTVTEYKEWRTIDATSNLTPRVQNRQTNPWPWEGLYFT